MIDHGWQSLAKYSSAGRAYDTQMLTVTQWLLAILMSHATKKSLEKPLIDVIQKEEWTVGPWLSSSWYDNDKDL